MKRTGYRRFSSLLFVVVIGIMVARPVHAGTVSHSPRSALGLMLGAPTALSFKQWLGGPNAWDLALGVGPGVRIHGDYLWGLAQLLSDTSTLSLDLYVGVGPVLGVSRGWCGRAYRPRYECGDEGDFFVGARVPIGLDLPFKNAPVEFGLELAPGLWLGPDFSALLLDVALFVRVLL